MTGKQVRGKYTLEFKLEAVRQVRAGQAASAVAKVLGIPKASVSNWVRQSARGSWKVCLVPTKRSRSRQSR